MGICPGDIIESLLYFVLTSLSVKFCGRLRAHSEYLFLRLDPSVLYFWRLWLFLGEDGSGDGGGCGCSCY